MPTAKSQTNLSDFHKVTLTILKIHCEKAKPVIDNYWNYKNFSNEGF